MSSLRERRRRQTAHDIQTATLSLAEARGFHAVTTDAIAQAAGISPRTFFNYFPNKEAAALGEPPHFAPADLARLRAGRGPLAADLRRFVDAHVAELAAAGEAVRRLGVLAAESPKVRALLDQFLHRQQNDLADALAARPAVAPETAWALAAWSLGSVTRALDHWQSGGAATLEAALDHIWAAQIEAARLVAGRP